ncbi:TetR/AcrR family transcriptional regulator [Agromyces aerolatus]|uniref:TetR/AcrR family transcriptional regulator n=1 Tax=Agromyces sp. LY-1074 TaxID=3074080 RepID=UPI00285D4747|nr:MULTISPECIES: TetR/AcrR family transcriptional regulator [unclassified Agromyces]MDR5699383.1 TetR/AcrR family transcriptional regulator [Agromyces sp. LY-1074]MDR5705679.1 TetR/AcrR family transcriptional regulator [Agromyces sp. LY-1358]
MGTNYHSFSTGRQSRYRKQTRDQLVVAAAREFERVGYARASLAVVCDAAGLTTGAFYHYFDSKIELAGAILTAQLPRVQAMADEVASNGSSSVERLLGFLASLSALLANDELVRAAARLAVDRTIGEASELFAPWAELATKVIEGGAPPSSGYTIDVKPLGALATSLVVGAWFGGASSNPARVASLIRPLSTAFVVGVLHPAEQPAAHEAADRVFERISRLTADAGDAARFIGLDSFDGGLEY